MRRFLITSPYYDGEAELLFDETGRLIKMDISDTNMSAGKVQKFKDKVPALVNSLEEAFSGTAVKIIENDATVEFKSFWNAYQKKINKARCTPLWDKLPESDKVRAVMGIIAYDKYLKSLPYQRPKADPETYLKDRYWENEWK